MAILTTKVATDLSRLHCWFWFYVMFTYLFSP